MNSRPFATTLSVLLITLLIVPSVFFIAPPKAHAIFGVGDTVWVLGDTSQTSLLKLVKDTLTAINTYTSMVADTAQYVNTYVLEPLAFVLSGELLKSMTAGVIAFVDGQSNGTGSPQFVQDLQGNLQTVGDVQARAFLTQFNQNSNSPFASAVVSSLQTNYLQHTSLAGFFAENKNTLDKYSPNPTAFLSGDFSQGGVGAWFALTTQNQNNPYTLYQASQSELSTMVAGATSARLAELNWGKGFLSWCGSLPSGGAPVGVPTDPCTKSDGTPGMIKTPGSVIQATLNTALGTTFGKLVNMGNASAEINSIMGNIATTLDTVNFATQILGGSGSGGLFGAGGSGALAQQYRDAPGYLGVTQSGVSQSAASLPFSGSDMLNRVSQYQAAWAAINTAATAASASVNDLINYCSASGTSSRNATIISDAQAALANEINPVFTQVAAASSIASAAQAMVQKVQTELTSGASGAGGSYTADIQTLQTMPPTAADVANAQAQALSSGVTASSTGSVSLSVTGYSLVDQMNLISANAQTLKSSCTSSMASSTAP